jgi:predicted DNA-binding ribbon-helix-helix protein
MASSVKKRSVVFGTRKTSVSLEDEFWQAINHIAQIRQISLGNFLSMIEGEHRRANLSSAIRVFVLEYYRSRSGTERTDARIEQHSLESKPSITNQTAT